MRADTPGTAVSERTSAVKGVLKAGEQRRNEKCTHESRHPRDTVKEPAAASAEQRTERN
jgi:hypothetical protein